MEASEGVAASAVEEASVAGAERTAPSVRSPLQALAPQPPRIYSPALEDPTTMTAAAAVSAFAEWADSKERSIRGSR